MSLILNPYRYASVGGGNPHNKIVVLNTTVSAGLRYCDLDGGNLTRINVSPSIYTSNYVPSPQWLDDQQRFVYVYGADIRTVSLANTDNVLRATHSQLFESMQLSTDGTRLYVSGTAKYGYYDDLGSATWTWNQIAAVNRGHTVFDDVNDRMIGFPLVYAMHWRTLSDDTFHVTKDTNPKQPGANAIDTAGERLWSMDNSGEITRYDMSSDTFASGTLISTNTHTQFEWNNMHYCPTNDRVYYAVAFDTYIYWIDASQASGAGTQLVNTTGRISGLNTFYMTPP